MFEIKNHFVKQLCFLILSFQLIFTPGLQGSTDIKNDAFSNSENNNDKRVGSIIIKGDGLINIGVVRNYLSFHEGSSFSEEAITRSVKKIQSTGYFKNTQIFKSVNEFDPSKIDIYVKLEEKALLQGYEFEGNRQISSKKLAEITGLKDMESVSIHDIKHFKNCIINEYYKMNYLNFKVDVIIKVSKGKQNKVNLIFKCDEGARLRLKEVDFDGCHNVLKSAMAEKLYTKEDWLLSPINGAGKFNWELLEIDKSNIQRYYMDRGYYKAGVVDTIIDKNEKTNDVSVKFVIEEGDLHKVRFVDLPSDEIYPQEFLERQMLIGKGDVFSTSKLVSSMDRIKNLFGINGYVFCSVYPDVTPVVVDGEMFVDIKINVDKGSVYKINEIRIFGNFKTREYVIRRELLIKEGGLANKVAMDSSLIRIEALGYFDRNLDWKITKVSEDQVDLELQVKEVKTGSGNIGLTMSPDKGSNNATVKFAAEIKKRNFGGLGWDLGGAIACGKDSLQKVDLDFRNPAIFNSNVFFNSKLFMNKVSYSELNVMKSSPVEKTAGFASQFGFYLFPSSLKITAAVDVGCNHVSFSDVEFKNNLSPDFLETMMRDRFKQGLYSWVGVNLGQNKLNHPLYPSQGWAWNSGLKMSVPGIFNNQYSMVKSEFSAKYFTSIIGKERLVFSATAILGRVFELSDNQPIPFQELYLVGGADSLRGYRWGEAGPSNKRYNSPLGAKKELLARFELISPATIHDISIDTPRAYVFYDVGAAWDTPITYAVEKVDGRPVYNNRNQLVMKRLIPEKDIIKNKFDLRHSVGIGFRMTVPQPIKIEWGYKLNKKALTKERPSEWHLTMNMPFDF